jgi:hypothetical protein
VGLREGPASGRWVPVPKDRDLAFVNFDGLVLDVIGRSAAPGEVRGRVPEHLRPDLAGALRGPGFLAGLSWAEWEPGACDLQSS